MMKVVCDASSLISLADSCLIEILDREYLNAEYVISPRVKHEAVDYPINKKMYSFSAHRIKNLMDKGKILMFEQDVKQHTSEIITAANSIFYVGNRNLKLIHEGEAEMLALATALQTPYILMDERTTRAIIENHENLKIHLESEFQQEVVIDEKMLRIFLKEFGNVKIFRSSEMIITAWQKGFFKDYSNDVEALGSALYRIKFAGCAISFNEIEEYLRSIR